MIGAGVGKEVFRVIYVGRSLLILGILVLVFLKVI